MKFFSRLLKEARQTQAIFFLSISLSLVAGVFGVFQAREISRLINNVFLQGVNFGSVTGLFVLILLVIVLRAGFAWIGELSASTAARRIKQSLRQRLYAHIVDLGPAFLRNEVGESRTRTGELVNLASEGMDSLEIYYSQYLPQIALAALIPLSIVVFVFTADTLSGIVLLVTAPLLPVFMYLIGSAAQALTRKQWRGLSRMSAYFLDVIQGLVTLKSIGRSREQVDVISKVSETYRQSTMSVLKVTFLSALVLELIATLSTAVVAVEIGVRLLYGRLAFEQAFFILLLAPEFYLPLRLLGTRFHAGMAGSEAGKQLFEILDLPANQGNQVSADQAPQSSLVRTSLSIVFKNVRYTYSDGHNALQDVSFTLPAGQRTALTGATGAGKTTLTWLLLRFLQPQAGEILVNGMSLSSIPPAQWRSNLAWVPQNPYLFNDTIKANISLARPNASDHDIRQAAQRAHADEFIIQLPLGYDTLIGERGTRLSSGQAQRIALARAFLKDAPLLILDEATSHLDPELDAQLQDSLERLAQERTVLVIAHHRSTLAKADQVIHLNHGQVEQISETEKTSDSRPLETNSIESVQISTIQSALPAAYSSIEKHEIERPRRKGVEKRLFKLLSPFYGRVLLSVLLGVATILSSVGLMATAAYIISSAALHPSIADLQVAIVGVRFFGISRGVFRYLERLVSHDVTFRLLARWRAWFYQALEPLAPARLMQYHSGDLLSRIIADIGSLESFYVRSISPSFVAVIVSIAMFGLMSAFGNDLAWLLLAVLLFTGLGLPVLTLILSRRPGKQLADARAKLNTVMVDGFQGLPDLLACDQAHSFLQRVRHTDMRVISLQKRIAGISALQNAIGSLLANLGMLAVLTLAVKSASGGRLEGVFLGVVALVALTSFEAILPLPQVAQNLEGNRTAALRLYELVDANPAVHDPSRPMTLPSELQLDFQHVSFQYPAPGTDNTIKLPEFSLKNISFSLPEGKQIAIVGQSGAGKTTLISLLQRFWDYDSGAILLGGEELRGYRQDEVRKQFAVVSQNTYIFSATIAENLLIAHPGAARDEIIAATQAAQLHDLIDSLPDGYNTWVGEHGLRLSAGERQRLAIARALLKNAPFLILDEPTANLDPVTESVVMKSIRELSRRRSVILITQRLVGLEAVDEILVLKDGQIIERGTHSDLIAIQGSYQRMWKIYNQII